tara:strand:+ start:855 stop:1877 length:1023 start_codon:yes stop_codon:yes gene_type:complete
MKWRPQDMPWAKDLTPHYGAETGGTPSSAAVSKFLAYATAFLACPVRPLRFPPLQPHCNGTPVVDLFRMSYDIDQVEIRLYEHSRFVDLFVIVESTVTDRGAPKPLFFPSYQSRFAHLGSRLLYLVHNGTAHHVDAAPETAHPQDWRNEDAPRQYGFQQLKHLRLPTPFVVISGDADELWSTPPPCNPPAEGLCPHTVLKYRNTVSRGPEVVRLAHGGQTPVAFMYPTQTLPHHRCVGHHRGVGFHLGGFLSPVAWLAKEVSLAESWGIARRHGDPRARLADPYLIYKSALNRGAAPCCPVPLNQRARQKTDRIPLALRRFGRARYPYLMGSDERCVTFA